MTVAAASSPCRKYTYTEEQKERRRRWNRAYKKAHPEKRAAYARTEAGKRTQKKSSRKLELRKYGLSLEEYDALFLLQGGLCAVCGQPPIEKSLAVDHCHKTQRVRGLLCISCNLAIGNMADDPARLRSAAAYLERNSRR